MTEILEWTNEQVIRLINSYKARGMLWDPNHDLYRVQTAKYEAWCELAELYGCEITDLRKKFNSILASHRREKAKIRMGGRSTWFAYSHLSFLPNHMHFERSSVTRTKSKKNSVEEEPMEEEHLEFEAPLAEPSSDPEEYEDTASHSPVHIIVKEEPEITPPTPPKYYRTVKTTMQERIHQRKLEKEKLERLADKKRRLLERKHSKGTKFYTNKKDECDSFGEYIAISLRKHDERTRSMIKQAINNILFEQEMKKYNSGQYTVLYEGGDVNPLIVSDECEK